ncbi:SlyX family protein [Breoghania sp. L-A4]|uniref:SlyX family protein n=1 Tax=Breoghania sp. L-A4 TaxID=2304600 RepID=UPI000E35B86E|nr:SlyX family protein [Breoghania sp. L-A4]AXS39429.1 hypothetical protein D1F64_04440 [Breoghania sp. L-A4]
MSDDTRERLEKLETEVAHQAHTIDELNGVVTEQARQIERLNRRMTALVEHVEELNDLGDGNVPVTKPPHY